MLKEKMRWTFFADMLWDEYRQCADEGRRVEKYAPEIEKVLAFENEEEKNIRARELLLCMENAPVKEDYKYDEPVNFEEIKECLDKDSSKRFRCKKEELKERISGALYGRTAACVLGIPVEGWTRRKIKEYLEATGQMPPEYYISAAEDEEIRKKFDICEEDITTPYDRQKMCWYNYLEGKFPNDDDINYTVIALKILERYGRNFTMEDVAESWLLGIPAFHACTAERVAIRNLMNGVLPPKSGLVCNPYREWIGAQIRGDFWGYINPGNPGEAARMAYLDASVSHVKNGVYSEMYIAALVSMCFVPGLTMAERIEQALLQIPPESRLKESLDEVCRWKEQGRTFEMIVDEVHKRYDEKEMYDWCLAIPNAMLVTACLLSYNDFNKAVGSVILAGFDTDCNGATVGSIIGASCGFGGLDSKWFEGFEKNVYTSVHGYHEISFKKLAERTLAQVERIT